MKKTIHFFIPTKIGGAETVSHIYAKILSSEYKVIIVFVGESFDIPKDVPFKKLFFKAKQMKLAILRLYSFLKKNKVKLMFTSLHGIAIPLLILNLFIPQNITIVRQSFMPNRYHKNSITTLLIRLLYPRAHFIIAQTKEMKMMMVEYYRLKPEKIKVVNNPIDKNIENLGKSGSNPFEKLKGTVYLSIGNIRAVKGQDVLIKAFKFLNEIDQNSFLYIVGQYSSEDQYFLKLKQLVIDYGLSEKVVFTGFISKPYNYLINANCLVLSSRSEGLPNILLEAAYLKIPIVSTSSVPVIERIIIDDKNGYTVPVDKPRNLAEAMAKAIRLDITENKNIIYSTHETIIKLFDT